jgi:hypothetical protein
VHGDAIETALIQGLVTLYVPAALSLSKQEEDGLILFAKMGGILILEACAGLFDETGLLRSDSRLLGDLVGLKVDGVDCCEKIEIRWNDLPGEKFIGMLQRQLVSVRADDVDVLARFPNGEPAVCKRAAGNGTVIWVGTFCASVPRNTSKASPVTRWARKQGYTEIDQLCAPEGTFVRLHRSLNDQILAVAVNFNHRPIEVKIGGLRQDDGSNPPLKIGQSPARDGVSFLI